MCCMMYRQYIGSVQEVGVALCVVVWLFCNVIMLASVFVHTWIFYVIQEGI